MLKIKDSVDLNYLIKNFGLRLANHCDEAGQYIFYSDTFYIDIYDRTIHIEGRNLNDLLFLYNLIQAGLVEKEF